MADDFGIFDTIGDKIKKFATALMWPQGGPPDRGIPQGIEGPGYHLGPAQSTYTRTPVEYYKQPYDFKGQYQPKGYYYSQDVGPGPGYARGIHVGIYPNEPLGEVEQTGIHEDLHAVQGKYKLPYHLNMSIPGEITRGMLSNANRAGDPPAEIPSYAWSGQINSPGITDPLMDEYYGYLQRRMAPDKMHQLNQILGASDYLKDEYNLKPLVFGPKFYQDRERSKWWQL